MQPQRRSAANILGHFMLIVAFGNVGGGLILKLFRWSPPPVIDPVRLIWVGVIFFLLGFILLAYDRLQTPK